MPGIVLGPEDVRVNRQIHVLVELKSSERKEVTV